MFLGLLDLDPDPLVRGMDPDPDLDYAYIGVIEITYEGTYDLRGSSKIHPRLWSDQWGRGGGLTNGEWVVVLPTGKEWWTGVVA